MVSEAGVRAQRADESTRRAASMSEGLTRLGRKMVPHDENDLFASCQVGLVSGDAGWHEPGRALFARRKDDMQDHRAYGTRFPFGACPDSRNVLINSPSPHTFMAEKRLYHSPSGTSGSVSSHAASNSSCLAGIFRL